jgi:polysaccharide pyruvyl transferase WcaK-like protein
MAGLRLDHGCARAEAGLDVERPRRIGLLAHCGNGNLGDEATLATIIEGIRRRDPTALVCAFTANPEDTAQRHRIEAFPLRRTPTRQAPPGDVRHRIAAGLRDTLVARLKTIPLIRLPLKGLRAVLSSSVGLLRELVFVVRSARRLRGFSMLVVAGGGQLGDYFGGISGYPYYILRWAVLARAVGARIVFLSVGAGPIASPVSGLFFRAALSLALYRSFRDQASRQLVEEIGVRDDNHVIPDVVLGLSPPVGWRTSSTPRSGLTVAINPLPYFDHRYWTESNASIYHHHVITVAAFATWLLENGHRVVLFPTQLNADPPVIDDVRRLLRALPPGQRARLIDRSVGSLESLLAVISSADVVVAGRYHGQVLGLVFRKPVIGLAYDRKTRELLHDIGLEYFALDIVTADSALLRERFRRLVGELDDVRAVIDRGVSDHRRIIETQYDMLFGQSEWGGRAHDVLRVDADAGRQPNTLATP